MGLRLLPVVGRPLELAAALEAERAAFRVEQMLGVQPCLDAFRQVDLLLCGQEVDAADLLEVVLDRVGGGACRDDAALGVAGRREVVVVIVVAVRDDERAFRANGLGELTLLLGLVLLGLLVARIVDKVILGILVLLIVVRVLVSVAELVLDVVEIVAQVILLVGQLVGDVLLELIVCSLGVIVFFEQLLRWLFVLGLGRPRRSLRGFCCGLGIG